MTLQALGRHRDALVEYHNAYVECIEPGQPADPQRRGRLVELIPAAQEALDVAGVEPIIYPPPAFGGPVLRGLANLTFAHERPGYGRDAPRYVIDATRLAGAELEKQIRVAERKRRNPLYWIDTLLRSVLSIPAYIVSLFLPGWSVHRLHQSLIGPILKVISALGSIGGIYFGGDRAGWW